MSIFLSSGCYSYFDFIEIVESKIIAITFIFFSNGLLGLMGHSVPLLKLNGSLGARKVLNMSWVVDHEVHLDLAIL